MGNIYFFFNSCRHFLSRSDKSQSIEPGLNASGLLKSHGKNSPNGYLPSSVISDMRIRVADPAMSQSPVFKVF